MPGGGSGPQAPAAHPAAGEQVRIPVQPLREGLSVYRIKADVLAQLQPDLIVTQEQCAVCAVSYDEVVAATRQVLHRPVAIVSLKPTRLADIFVDMQHVADAAGCSAAG